MNDDELERRLRAYRPADPPRVLRARVVDASMADPGARGFQPQAVAAWLPAVAAALIASAFYWLAGTERLLLDARLPVIPSIEQQIVDVKEPQ